MSDILSLLIQQGTGVTPSSSVSGDPLADLFNSARLGIASQQAPQIPEPESLSKQQLIRANLGEALLRLGEGLQRVGGVNPGRAPGPLDALRELASRREQIVARNQLSQQDFANRQQDRRASLDLQQAQAKMSAEEKATDRAARAAEREEDRQFKLMMFDKQDATTRDLAEFRAQNERDLAELRNKGRTDPGLEAGFDVLDNLQNSLLDSLEKGEELPSKRLFLLRARANLTRVPPGERTAFLRAAELFYEDVAGPASETAGQPKPEPVLDAPGFIPGTTFSANQIGGAIGSGLESVGAGARKLLGGDKTAEERQDSLLNLLFNLKFVR